MRDIACEQITDCVARLCMACNVELPCDAEGALRDALRDEPWAPARATLGDLVRNLDVARSERIAICQDTGIVTVFLEVGQDAHIAGGSLEDAVNEGVRRGYEQGYLRKSVVADPLRRVNTNDNTPAVVHTRIVPGDTLRVTVMPKGAGSENMCAVKMLTPAQSVEGVRRFVVDTVATAGGKPCPPIVVGVGVGGTSDSVGLLAKEALLRPLGEENPDPLYAELEADLLEDVNALGIGPEGLGGKTTALRVLVKAAPTHIAMLPVAVCISCHVLRHATEVL